MKNEWIIETENLCYTYEGNDRRALDGVNVKIRRGRKVAFMGGNGSGKSTLFLCLNGILRPESGRVIIDGIPVKYNRKGLLDVRKKVGIVFQEPDNQLFSASVYQEISFGILNLGADEVTARREVERVMEEVGITAFSDRPAHALSGGQKKQVAIADILVMHPEVMILDEPAAALDPKHTRIVEEIIERQLKKYKNKLIAQHQSGGSFQPSYMEQDFDEDEEVKIVRTKRFDIKPMYPEDACVQMELLGHSFFVFYNAETDQVNVVYKRKGNTYGLIEPEE